VSPISTFNQCYVCAHIKNQAQSQQASAKLGEMFEELNFRRRKIEF